jgi:ribosome-associated translation inhibitor RaiA
VELTAATRKHVHRRLGRQLGKFALHIERVTVRVRDVNGPRGGVDHACQLKVVLSKRPSVLVEARAHTPRAAFDLAADRTERAVRREIGRAGLRTPRATATAEEPPLPPVAPTEEDPREDSAHGLPSRKTMRLRPDRARRDNELRLRELRRLRSPGTRARRNVAKRMKTR